MKIRVFTDGACKENPGPGGWAALFNGSNRQKMIGGYDTNTTNNRMEMTAVLEALKNIEKLPKKYDCIEIHTDSGYVMNAIVGKWICKWKLNGWVNSKKEPVKNKDLWILLDEELKKVEKNRNIMFVKVKGHSGNTFNDMVDKRAKEESNIAKAILEKNNNKR